jgi:hypothetical protein
VVLAGLVGIEVVGIVGIELTLALFLSSSILSLALLLSEVGKL